MSNSFSVELDKYLDKKSKDNGEPKNKKIGVSLNKIPLYSKFKEVIKQVKERQEVIDIQEDSSLKVHVVDKKPIIKQFTQAFSDIILQKKTEDFDLPIEEAKKKDIIDISELSSKVEEKKKEDDEKRKTELEAQKIMDKSQLQTNNEVKEINNEKLLKNAHKDVEIVDIENNDEENKNNKNINLFTNNFKNHKNINEDKDYERIEVQEEPDNIIENLTDKLSQRDQKLNETFSDKEMKSILNDEDFSIVPRKKPLMNIFNTTKTINRKKIDKVKNENSNNETQIKKILLYKPKVDQEVKESLKTTYKMIKLLPKPALEEFRKTNDYQKYIKMLKKYDIVKSRKDLKKQ
jgi:hypothetical protein